MYSFYRQHLEKQLLPFWLAARDQRYGGVFTCWDNAGEKLLNHRKYSWSQGRYLWLLARLLKLIRTNLLDSSLLSEEQCLQDLQKTADFLLKHAILENGHCSYLLSADGQPFPYKEGGALDASVFADCFVALGLGEYAHVCKKPEIFEEAKKLYRNIIKRFAAPEVMSEPYPVPSGYKVLAFPMIRLNVSNVLYRTAKALQDHDAEKWLKEENKNQLQALLEEYFDEQGASYEFKHPKDEDSLLVQHGTPGHSIECAWFMHEAALLQGLNVDERLLSIVEQQWKCAWDTQEGGILRYSDRWDAKKPQGRLLGLEYEESIQNTWDYKLWWTHSEWLYALLRFRHLDTRFSSWYQQLHDYVFSVFPAPEGREWIQIRNRQGQAVEEVVALPLKDPFHIMRNVILSIELLAEVATPEL